ncbi:hypothetical protein T31B1_13034 [Salinisphaera sp. T31B1]
MIGLYCSRAFAQACQTEASGTPGRALGGLGVLMVVDYHASDIGPYRELLLCPGRFASGGRRRPAITHIWVSTRESVVNGRHHWGLPKKLAEFDNRCIGGREIIRVQRTSRPAVTFDFRPTGPRLPIGTALVPRAWRTLLQTAQSQRYATTPTASGRLRAARLCGYHNPPGSGFPDISGQRRLCVLAIDSLVLEFPTACVEPVQG